MLLGLYRALTHLGGGVIEAYLDRRIARGKEDPRRIAERRGAASLARPEGKLFWMHAASNGEAMSALPLAHALLRRYGDAHLLLTTGTVTSAELVADKLPERAFHQFVPVDRPTWVRAFLDHWRPDAGIWVESEFWPNLIMEMRRDGRPMALVNGRISARSLTRWKRAAHLARTLLSSFHVCLAQTRVEARRLEALGARNPDCIGNLKHAAPNLPVDENALQAMREALGERPVWLAASTHPGEEAMVLDVHRALSRKRPGLLTIIVPRHPVRGPKLFEELRASGMPVWRRTLNDTIPSAGGGIYLADTLGELGLFYRLAETVLVGGTLLGGIGGHNPIEPARLCCAILFGPDMTNFEDMASDMKEGGAARETGASTLARDVAALLDNPDARSKMIARGSVYAEEGAEIPEKVLERLRPILEAP